MMTDGKGPVDQTETPEDVATLYSWANLHGAKYRDFSALRAQTREKVRQRVQEDIEDERRQAAEAAHVVETQRLAALVAPQTVPQPASRQLDSTEKDIPPAWLSSDHVDLASPPVPLAPGALQGARDGLTSRWFALKNVFEDTGVPVEAAAAAPAVVRPPVLAVFSLAGGVGKTSIVATLGRALSARGERVLLVDTAVYSLLPYFFGANDQRSGVLRTFNPPSASGDAPIQMVAIPPESLGSEAASLDALPVEISRYAREAGRVMIDLATASSGTIQRVIRMTPTFLVPVIPDMNSVVSVSAIEGYFRQNANAAGAQVLPTYVLNQFDSSVPLHLEVREVLRERLGDRLLPFALRRAAAVSEALAEGMTVMDYAPNSAVAEDFDSLAGWVKSLAAPVRSSYRGVRWSER
jgi:cellulose synthase operon protein YhjQ